jgi:uncharacterized protein
MKKIFILSIAATIMQAAVGQQQPININPYPKTINVNGSASMEIVPDEIYVNIQLGEYQKKGEARKDLEMIKTQFLETSKKAGIPDSLISIVSYSGYNNYFQLRKKKKNEELNATITYQVKFKSSRLMDELVEELDDEATKNFSIVSVSHSRITQFRRELKIKAIQTAKEKGIYLTEAIGEKLGDAVTINEPGEWQSFPYENTTLAQSNRVYNENRDLLNPPSEIDFKKIKLKFDVSVVFALK